MQKNDGFILIIVMGFICVSALFLYVGLEAISGSLKANACLKEISFVQATEKSIQESLWLQAIEATRKDTFNLNNAEVNALLQWVLPEDVLFKDTRFSGLLSPLFIKGLDEGPKDIVSHPLHKKRGNTVTQHFDIKFSKKNHPTAYSSRFEIAFKALPSTEFAFISEGASAFSPENSTIDLKIEGDALVPSYNEKASGVRAEFQNLFCKAYVKDPALKELSPEEIKTKVHGKLWESHKFIFSYGMHPSRYLLPTGEGEAYELQAYCKHPDAKVIHFDGKALDHAYPGMGVQAFEREAERVMLDLALMHGQRYPKVLYIYCTTDAARNVGIVIKGTKQHNTDGPVCILTNGRMWLWGNHLGEPVIIGSTHGSWTLMEDAWKGKEAISSTFQDTCSKNGDIRAAVHGSSRRMSGEADGAYIRYVTKPNPEVQQRGTLNCDAYSTEPLSLTWKGYLISPVEKTFFSSPHSAKKDGQLRIQGTLLVGSTICGNLKEIRVSESAEVAEALANFSEKLVMPVSIAAMGL